MRNFLISTIGCIATLSLLFNHSIAQTTNFSCNVIDSIPYTLSTGSLGTYSLCSNKTYYAPSLYLPDQRPKITVYINWHFMLKDSGMAPRNFTEVDDGDTSNGNTSWMNGYWLAEALVENMNLRLQSLVPPNIPLGNSIPAVSPQFQFEIYKSPNDTSDRGIYFHRNTIHSYFGNISHGSLKSTYSAHGDTVIDIFFMEQLNGGGGADAVLNGSTVRYNRVWEGLVINGGNWWDISNWVNHEVGHNLGLSHTLRTSNGYCCSTCDDGCDDTPTINEILALSQPNPCCWDATDSIHCSNNMMDYNNSMVTLTPCQLGLIHQKFVIKQSNYTLPNYIKKDYCTITSPDLVLDSIGYNFEWTSARFMTGNIVIKSGSKLTVKCLLGMPKGSSIVVETGAKLIVDEGVITGACGNPWDGIQVHGIMNQTQNIDGSGMSNQGYLVLNDAIIENASNAVRVHNPVWSNTNFHGGGGIVQATNSTFRNNRRDVEFLKYAPNTSFNWFVGNRSYFRNCSFETTDVLPEGKNPTAHVTMWGTTGIKFEGCNFQNTRTSGISSIDQLGNGIHSIDAHYRVVTNPDPYTGRNSVFTNLNEGIKAGNAAQLLPIFVKGATFNKVYRGITLNKANYSVVADNLFFVGRTNTLTSMPSYPYGLGLNYSSQFTCSGNIFNYATGATALSAGIWYNHTGGMENESSENTFNNIPVAQIANGVNRTVLSTPTSTPKGLQLLCNEHSGSSLYDITVFEEFWGGLPIGEEGIRDLQGRFSTSDVSVAGRNTFSSPSLSDGHIGNYGKHITYYTLQGQTIETPTQIDDLKVTVVELPSSKDCIYSGDEIPGDRKLNPSEINELKIEFATHKQSYHYYKNLLDTLIDGGNTENVLNNINTAYPNGAWALRNQLLGMSPFLSDTVLFAAAARQDVFSDAELFEFMVANPDGFWSDPRAAEEFLSNSRLSGWMVDFLWSMYENEYPITYRTLLESYRAQESEALYRAARIVTTDMLMDSTGFNPDTLIAWLANVEDYETEALISLMLYNKGHDSLTAYIENFNYFLEEEYSSGENLALEDAYQMNDLINFFHSHGTNFSDSLYQDIFTSGLVDSLPYFISNFRRVRNLADFFYYPSDSAHYNDHPVLSSISYKKEQDVRRKRASSKENNNPYVKAYPNPANRLLTIEYALPEGLPEADIKIVDLNGKIVWQQKVTEPQFLRNINLDSWQNGFYQYSASYKGISIGSGKVVVIK